MTRGRALHLGAGLAALALALTLPLVLSETQMALTVRALLFAMLGTAWNLMAGYAGQFSFGHAAFFGLGAYAGGYLLTVHGVSPWVGMLVGAALAGAFGALTGFLSFRYRLRGAYFALATFAFAEMLRLIAQRLDLVNQGRGFHVPLLPDSSLWMLQFPEDSPAYYYIALGLLVATMLVVVALLRSRAGHFFVAIREDEEAADSLGVDSSRYKVLAVTVSAALTAVAGVFYLQYYFFIDPELGFGAPVSVQILLPAVIGGAGTLWGPVVGAGVLVALGELSSNLIRNPPSFLSFLSGRAGLDVTVYALALILTVVFLPRGVFGTLRERLRR